MSCFARFHRLLPGGQRLQPIDCFRRKVTERRIYEPVRQSPLPATYFSPAIAVNARCKSHFFSVLRDILCLVQINVIPVIRSAKTAEFCMLEFKSR